jgi:hypothetical protein
LLNFKIVTIIDKLHVTADIVSWCIIFLIPTNQFKIGNTQKNIQSLMRFFYGFLCLAFVYFLNVSKFRTKNIIYDASIYIHLFEDLDKVNDVYKKSIHFKPFFYW